jgi:hypothetical protein
MAHKLRGVEPIRPQGRADFTVDEMDTTVADFYQGMLDQRRSPEELALDTDLTDIFKASRRRKKNVRPAADLLRENRKAIVDKVAYWTGVGRPRVQSLVEAILARVAELDLRADTKSEREHLTELTAYATALAMNYLTRGRFVPAEPRSGRKATSRTSGGDV